MVPQSGQRRTAAQKNNKPFVIHMDVRKLKGYPDTNLPSFSKAKLEKLIEEAVVDACGEEEQVGGFLRMMEEHLALPLLRKYPLR